MDFIRLPSNSEKILFELVQSDNPVQVLCDYFERASQREEDELYGILRELRENGYVNIEWADNLPYIVTLNNSARTYSERLAEYEAHRENHTTQKNVKSAIFISHRSTDKEIADMLVDFFAGTGILKDAVFCSSLPGNDVNEKISEEVKTALRNSAVNIAILSHEYYSSAYCLNEAGVFWYEDAPVIPIALPEINSNNMYGFLDNGYKLRRLNSDTDISYIYDIVSEAISAQQVKASIITHENNKLRARYAEWIKARELPNPSPVADIPEMTTDDEQIVLYYILSKKVRRVSKADILQWLNESEIHNVNVDNAFDLLSSFEGGIAADGTLEFGLEAFRKYSAIATNVLPELKECVDRHTKLAVNTFKEIWNADTIDSTIGLFIAYIVDERIQSLGDRWMAEGQIESINQWENKNILDPILSSNYGSGLGFLIQNDLVYESSWTSYGNPREYTLCPSLQEFLFDCPVKLAEELKRIKDAHTIFPWIDK